MKILIVGAGTIGVTYVWLLSACHDVSILVKPEYLSGQGPQYNLHLQDLRDKTVKQIAYRPACVASIEGDYDAILVMVNRLQLVQVLPLLQGCSANIVFMLNHWDIEKEVTQYLAPGQYLYGFPSQVGGGRQGNTIEAIVFGEGTVLGERDGKSTGRLEALAQMFTKAGLSVECKPDILSWLKVHYLQQSISAGAILKAGGYPAFASDYHAVKQMVYAFREGLAVCEAQGIETRNIFPATLFRYPAFLVALGMKQMLGKPETQKMIRGHMKQGLPEWIAGYKEILHDGKQLGVQMPVWESYDPYIAKHAKG